MEVRYMCEKDLEQVSEIEKEVFSIPWSLEAFQDSLLLEHTIYLVAAEGDKVLGYCGMYHVMSEGEIVNVAVAPEFRRQQVAKKLLEFLFFESVKREIDNFFLEVRESNEPAIGLYESFGFEQVGIRKNFYEQPRENAIVMWKR